MRSIAALTCVLCSCYAQNPCTVEARQLSTIDAELVGSWEDDDFNVPGSRLDFGADGTFTHASQGTVRTGTWRATAAPDERVKTAFGSETLGELESDPAATAYGPLVAGVLEVTWPDRTSRGAVYVEAVKMAPAGVDVHATDDHPAFGLWRRIGSCSEVAVTR